MTTVYVLPKWGPDPYDGIEVDTTSNSGRYRDLSPFVLGPIQSYCRGVYARNFENLWQFSKVYPEHVADDGSIKAEWYAWRRSGWEDSRAHRYPMGKGRKPLFSFWAGERLGYIEARKRIYARIYAKYVVKTGSYKLLEEVYDGGQNLILRDYDGYDYIAMGRTLEDVINDPEKKMGHAFVLAMLLTGVLEEKPELLT